MLPLLSPFWLLYGFHALREKEGEMVLDICLVEARRASVGTVELFLVDGLFLLNDDCR